MKKPTLDPGRLRHRIRLEYENEIPDGCGGQTTNWQLVALVWAAIEPVSHNLISQTDTTATQNIFRISIRWRADCAVKMRFVKSGRAFVINSINDPDTTTRYLECICEERT